MYFIGRYVIPLTLVAAGIVFLGRSYSESLSAAEDRCEEAGGVLIHSRYGSDVCIDKSAVLYRGRSDD